MAGKRNHKATYSRDKKTGGYLIRVEGPSANAFAKREVPVTMKNGDEKTETLDILVWAGKDQESGEPVALYKFVQKPRDADEAEF